MVDKEGIPGGRSERVEPLYTAKDVMEMIPLIETSILRRNRISLQGVQVQVHRCRPYPNFSASLELWYQNSGEPEKKIVFSGDVGNREDNPIINDPQHTKTSDYVVVESTYGNREHKTWKRASKS